MKIKFLNGLLIVDILTILLVIAIIFAPSSVARIVLGLPFLLFFPGYALLSALFVNKKEMSGIEQVAISCGMSIAIVALIGLGLNYTSWGITLEPVLYSIAAFIIIVSAIARIRRAIEPQERTFTSETSPIRVKLGWEKGVLNKTLSALLIVSIVTAAGVLGYTIIESKTGETFTEFYLLGLNGQAQDYPSAFAINGGHVVSVQYNNGNNDTVSGWGKVTLGIVNHEQKPVNYSVAVNINNQPVVLYYDGKTVNQISDIQLKQDEKWEGQIGFAPQQTGNNQKVEFLLFKNGNLAAENSLHLWVNVNEVGK